MDSLGEYLKRERELRGITLRHISDVTKIHIKYLEALEENHFEVLPAEAFTRGFLRSYARCVGIDPDEAVLVYKQCLDRLKGSSTPSIPPVAFETYPPPPVQAPATPQEKAPSTGSPKLLITLLSLFLVLAVAFFAFVSSRAKRGPETSAGRIAREPVGSVPEPRTPGSEVNVPTLSQKAPADKAPKPEPTQKSPTASTSKEQGTTAPIARPPGTETAESQAPKNLALTINAKEDTWIQAVIDGTERREALIPAGSQVTWRAANKFVLVIGNVKGTEMTLNGTEIQVPEGQQNVLRDFVVTRELIR
ncbi:MAG: helix-turn-helix domain-containing protein [Candidatus Tectomicrobia bacterium]|uniref:Helix-turn-helix domain-containing protein n=1 Tax=Tectimicrobiota bacterium TaxID=2528274 RepID=A0A932GPH7_UNCTE|nr:helix-turn-helix domain-containing protein [Candidatus Tectomicrobia bacterium]